MPELPVSAAARRIKGGEWDKQVDNTYHKRCKKSAEQRNIYVSNEKLGDKNDKSTDQKTNDPPAERGYARTEHALDNPAQQGNDQCQKQGAPESADAELGNDPPHNHQNDCGNDKTSNMPKKLH